MRVRVEDSGEIPEGRRLVIRCQACGDVLAEHSWPVQPAPMVLYRHGLDDAAAIKAHALACRFAGGGDDGEGYA
jgi:hypothetical protein